MFGSSCSNMLFQYLADLEFDLTNYNPDTQNIISGYLPKANKTVYVLGEELHQLVSQAYDKSRESARNGDANKRENYQAYEKIRAKLITHVQHKKDHYDLRKNPINNPMMKKFPKENDAQAKEFVRILGEMEDFLWLVGVACECKLDQEVVGKDGSIERLAKKLFDDFGKVSLFSTSSIEEVKESLGKVKESYWRHDYLTTVQTIATVRQQIGCA